MSIFAIRHPFFILMLCLIVVVVGVTTVARMPVDLFPQIKIPVVVVATFYSGMPPQQIEGDITDTFERFFTLGSNIDHIESRSLTGVSLIKVYFQPGTDPDAAVSEIANLALADLRRLPQGTLPPVVLKFDASSMPVCLVTLKGKGLTETELHDQGQFNVRNQIANVPGASVPQPYGGRYRQIQFYIDPVKLQATQLSPMDVVQIVNKANTILPAGDLRVGPRDYNIYSNSQLPTARDMNEVPLKAIGNRVLRFGDIGHAEDSSAIQYNVVRVDGQKSVYLPILKQGGNSNTIEIVNGVRDRVASLRDVPKSLIANVVFDQSKYVKLAIANVLREGSIGLFLTAVMILVFLGSLRGTISVLLSIPISCLAAFLLLNAMGSTINTIVLGGLALVLSRLIDNSVVVLENIFRHFEMGEDAHTAAEEGGREVALAVLAATFMTAIVFFPVVFLSGVSKYLFTALAMGVVLALAGSYLVAMSVVPLFCSRFIKSEHGDEAHGEREGGWLERVLEPFNRGYDYVLAKYDEFLQRALQRPKMTVGIIVGVFVLSLALSPLLGDDDRHRGVGLDSDCRVHARVTPPRTGAGGSHQECLPCAPAADHDDNLCYVSWLDSARAGAGSGKRAIRAPVARHHRGAHVLLPGNAVSGSGCLLPHASRQGKRYRGDGGMRSATRLWFIHCRAGDEVRRSRETEVPRNV